MKKSKIFIYSFSILCSIVFLYPLFFNFISSFKDNDGIYNEILALPSHWRFENFIVAFKSANIHIAILNSLIYATGGTFLALVLGLLSSYPLARLKFKLNTPIYLYFTLGLMIPVFSMLIPISRIITAINGFNNYIVMIILYAVFELPLTIFLITGYMKGIPRELDESAIMDGCGPFRLLFQILAPLTMPAISTSGILAFFSIYNDLVWNVLFINNHNMYNISMGLLTFVGKMGSSQMGPTFASIFITIIPTIIVYLFFQEKIEKGLGSGSVKG
ncbi:carbohydrate ABC transporter permease [Neobacillus cucumis]|nr:carbohydrate ABC transporter permease [Neobacillus cucumis]